jgi:Carboxypeptidase regulatory-like domain
MKQSLWLGLLCGVVGMHSVQAAPLFSALGGTARLVGQVRDQQGQPLKGVTIQLGNLTTTTDASGTYTLEQVRPAQWEITFIYPDYAITKARVWLYTDLTTAQDARLIRPTVERPQVAVGLVGVGSLPRTDLFAQRLAADLVRLKGFPLVQPLTYFPREQVDPITQHLQHPLAEILDRDRQKPEWVSELFRYLGVKALVIARTDMLIKPSATSPDTELKARIRLELWRFNGDKLQIQVLAQESQEEKADTRLNETEANDLLAIQVTKMASRVSTRWQGPDSPWTTYQGNLTAEPTPRQVNTVTVEIVPRP